MKFLVAAALVFVSGTVAAQTSKGVAKPAEKLAEEKKTCRSMTPTGSFMSNRVCNTAKGWRAYEGVTADGAEQTRDVYRMPTTGVPH